MDPRRGQHINWKEPEVSTLPANGFHSKVNRTCSVVSLGGLPPTSPLTHRSSPDGSASEPESGQHLSTATGRKPIDDRAFSTAAAAAGALRYDDDAKRKAIISPSPQSVSASSDEPAAAADAVSQPYLGQNGDDDACALNRDMERVFFDLDASDAAAAVYSPVASESRGELLQCEGGSMALEDVLRHYWLLSDRDDELPKCRDNRSDSNSSATTYDWNSKRSESSSKTYRNQSGPANWVASKGPEIMNCDDDDDDDVDSVVTLSTISEEDEADLSSASEDDGTTRTNENGWKSFRDTSAGDVVERDDVKHDVTDLFDESDIDFLSSDKEEEDFDARSDLSANAGNVSPVPQRTSPIMYVREDDPLPSSSSMMDSFVRSISSYVSDIYPFSPAFVSQEPNAFVGLEGPSCRTESNPPMSHDPTDAYNQYTVTDTLVHIKLLSALDEPDFVRHRDQATNTLADQSFSDTVWSLNDTRNSITSPTSWYTVSDIFNSQSFETASEMAEDDPSESSAAAAVITANAQCTAVARCLASQLSQPLDLLPSSTVSVKVTAADPFSAIGRAAARAASQATSRAVRDFPTSSADNEADVVEIVVTTTCVLTRMNNLDLTDNNPDEAAVVMVTSDAAVETRICSVDVGTQSSNHISDYNCNYGASTTEKTRGIHFPASSGNYFRNTPTINGGSYFVEAEDCVVDDWCSAVDEAMQGSSSCSVAIPCTGPDGDVRPQTAEATYLPTTTGAVIVDGALQNFEVVGVAVKETARDRSILLPEETAGHKDEARGTDVVPFALNTTTRGPTRSLDKREIRGNFQGSDKKTGKFSGFFKKPGDSEVIDKKNDSLKTTNMDLKTVPEKCPEPAIKTSDDIPKSGIAIDNSYGQKTEQNPLTVESSSKSQQLCTAVDKLEHEKEDKSTTMDKNVDSKDETDLYVQYSVAKNNSDVLRRHFHSPFPQQLVSDDKNQKRNKSLRIQKSQSLFLETDIDTLEHRRTPVSRKKNRGSTSETKSCTDLSFAKVSLNKTYNSPFSFVHGDGTLISKEALAELLSDSTSPGGSFPRKQQSKEPRSSPPSSSVGHCLSEPNLQVSPGKESTASNNSAGNRSAGPGHLMDRFSSGARWRMYRSQESMSAKKQNYASSLSHTDTGAKVIERYEQSPSLRRRSLHILETTLQRRSSDTEAVQRTQPSETPPIQKLSPIGTAVARHFSSPASSSFENLVDSLLGITAVMSMGAAISHTRSSSYVPIPSEQTKPLGAFRSPRSLQRTVPETVPTSAIVSDEKKTRFEMGNEVGPVDQISVPLEDTSGSPVHATSAVRKHVHFRKAKHIFRKCHFCIDANERKSGPSSPSKSPSHETTTRRKTSAKKYR